ncbi:DNA-directed RNA polymerase YonO [Paenibacillus sp. JCM 10914]|uniref:RNA dependent RNA polymerase n=1 Tax=Paenibacillus sp. JCM 10914 TaxID=1236974 RepID=UPI0003CC7C97|nr:hydrolase [Paenibacillus sp. JCM 10914]GAE05284.1 hydrolase [Paenibacillus sp. JCM 10914]
MDAQVFIYSVDTSLFYTDQEYKLHRRLNKRYRVRKILLRLKTQYSAGSDYHSKITQLLTKINTNIKTLKESLKTLIASEQKIRYLRKELLSKKNIISVFESTLTRTLSMQHNQLTEDIMVIQTYYFEVLKSLIYNGFMYNGHKYICFTASAGQIRTKKTLFIKESVFENHRHSLMCGLTTDKINLQGGVNINKYLAYLALCNSATDQWHEFNIHKAIVVDDMETTLRSTVDFIDDQTYKITRQEMDIAIEHTDGCGMMLPKISKKSMMIRLPWVKGLLVPFPFDKFIREANRKGSKCGIVTDIYGKQYDILKDDIQIIFTKSQFKMWKYYNSWSDYKQLFVQHQCHASKCNEEEDRIANAKSNYQILQTLTDCTNEELMELSSKTREKIINIGTDRKTMLKILGVTDTNSNKNYFQQALEVYPELLNDAYSREVLKQVKRSMVKNARAGKMDIDGKYTFISPDLYAFCEYLFLGHNHPKGLLGNGEVFCSLYHDEEYLDCLRSPHLYREHAIRKNIVNKELRRWFTTSNLYTSSHDPISKLLMFDVDGDKSLVCNDKTLVKVAQRNMSDIYPLYYRMANANAETINKENIYRGLTAAYTGGNIGVISNDISKIWNSNAINLDVIKLLCMENNFTIDYAKTLYKPERPTVIKELITTYTAAKVPHFFRYAKDKLPDLVDDVNKSTMNRLAELIPNPRLQFKALNLGQFNYKMLLHNNKTDSIILNEEIINRYTELDLQKRFMELGTFDHYDSAENLYIYLDIREQLLEINSNPQELVDILVEYLYQYKKSSFKTTLWSSFGDILVQNLKNNLKAIYTNHFILCDHCGIRIKADHHRKAYCESCSIEKEKLRKRMAWHKNKYNNTSDIK